MTTTLLDFSQRRELALHARVVADVQAVATALKVPTMITGRLRATCISILRMASRRFGKPKMWILVSPFRTGRLSLA